MSRQEIEEKVRAFLIDDLEIDEDKIFPAFTPSSGTTIAGLFNSSLLLS